MAKTRAYGADCVLLAAFEASYGTAPIAGYTRLSFKDSTLGAERPLGYDPLLGQGRDAQDPFYDAIKDEGDIGVPLDLRGLGFWLKGLFGAPTTTGDQDGSFSHAFTSGGALPSLGLELGHAKLATPRFFRHGGAKLDKFAITMARTGAANATLSVVAQGETELANIRTLFEHGQKVEAVTLFLDKANARFKGLAEEGMGGAAKAAHDLGLAWEHLLETLSHTGMVQGARDALTGLVTGAAALLGNQEAQVTGLKGKIADLEGLRKAVVTDFARGNVDRQLADAKAELARIEDERRTGVTVGKDGKSLSAPMPPPSMPVVSPEAEAADALERDRKTLVNIQAEYGKTAAAMRLPQAQRELALVAIHAEDEALKLNLGTEGAAELKVLRLSEAKLKLTAATRKSITTMLREAQASDALTAAIGKGCRGVSTAAGRTCSIVGNSSAWCRAASSAAPCPRSPTRKTSWSWAAFSATTPNGGAGIRSLSRSRAIASCCWTAASPRIAGPMVPRSASVARWCRPKCSLYG